LRLLPVALIILLSVPAARAEETHCFGPDRSWCAWTMRADQPDDGWKVAHKVQGRGGAIQAVIDSPGNRPRLGIVLPNEAGSEAAQVIISLRSDGDRPDRWLQFVGRNPEMEDGALRLALGRRALEAVLQAPASADLYVFVEFGASSPVRKGSYKIRLVGLAEALRYARLGR
jgi:hypothetical protein